MKHLLRAMLVIAIVSVCLFSCKRESLDSRHEGGPNATSVSKPGQSMPLTLEKIQHYRASPEEIAAEKKAWLEGVRRQHVATRGGCGVHGSSFAKLVSIQSGSCGSWTIRYLIVSVDLVGSGYDAMPVSASFTDVNSQSISATLIDTNYYLTDPNCMDWQWDGYCEMVREYTYELSNIPFQAVAPASAGNYSLQLLSGFASNCTPLTASGSLPGSLSASYYASNPARVYVQPVSSSPIFIGTDCSLLCYHPYYCPSSGSFTYWPLSNPPNTTTISIPTVGTTLSLSPGAYGYSVTLTYIIGGNTVVTQPLTGTFTVI